jgi:hypothetical protein
MQLSSHIQLYTKLTDTRPRLHDYLFRKELTRGGGGGGMCEQQGAEKSLKQLNKESK